MPTVEFGGPEAQVVGADPAITVALKSGGPYLVGQSIPIVITVTNLGTAEATGVRAYHTSLSGSYFSINNLGPLSSLGPGATIPAGEKVVVNTEGQVYNWQGVPVVRFTNYSDSPDSSWQNNSYDVTIPMTPPDSAKGSVSGLIYGDRNGNGSADAGEGLPGVGVSLNDYTPNPGRVRTDSDGRFRFSDLPVRSFRLSLYDAPDGWVLPRVDSVDVDGDEVLELKATRPLSDQLGASVEFTEDSYVVGQTTQILVTLTNKGSADFAGIKAACDRSGGEGPHVVDMKLGDLAWNASGVAVPAGQTRTFTITGVVPAKAPGFGAVNVACDFGVDEGEGRPTGFDLARVAGAAPGDTWGVLYNDLDDDSSEDPGERVEGVKVAAVDKFTGKVVAKAFTNAEGRVEFKNLPAGPYELKLYGPWKFRFGGGGFYIGTCGTHCGSGWYMPILAGPDNPDTDPDPVAPVPPAAGAGAPPADGALANTGAHTVGLVALGVLMLVTGFGAAAIGRRRRLA